MPPQAGAFQRDRASDRGLDSASTARGVRTGVHAPLSDPRPRIHSHCHESDAIPVVQPTVHHLELHAKGDEGRDEETAAAREIGQHYSIIWSARPRSDCGIVRPIALAVFRLMTRSNFVGCSTGRSPGFPPLRILSTK